MSVSPQLRRAFHTALDVVLDALAEEAAGTKTKRTRTITPPPLAAVPAEEIEAATRSFERAGYRRKT